MRPGTRAELRQPQLRRLRSRDGGGRRAEPKSAAPALGPQVVPRALPARAPRSLQRQVLPSLAAALSGLRRTDVAAALGAPRAAGGGLSAGPRPRPPRDRKSVV